MESRWWVEVWNQPPGPERYRDPHPEHRAKAAAMGEPLYCGTVESVGKLYALGREYKTRLGAERYASHLREQWGDQYYIEVVSGGILTF